MDRTGFPATEAAGARTTALQPASLDELTAFRFGHAQDDQAGTGCTVIIAPEGAVASVDVRGGGPATRETDLLAPENMIQAIHAVTLSGGSAFGLSASTGVMLALEERGIGFELLGMRVPIVCGACLFDLAVGDGSVRPDAAMGKAAVEAAFAAQSSSNRSGAAPIAMGNYGAGSGCSVAKMLGAEGAMKSGFGWAAYRHGDVVVGALVAVNALGCIYDRDGSLLAGVRAPSGSGASTPTMIDGVEAFLQGASDAPALNTTIGCVVTNAALTKAQAKKVASIAHDAYARVISPVHTSNDGDAIFCMAAGTKDQPAVAASMDTVAVVAVEAMQDAIINGVRAAKSAFGLPGLAGE